MKTWVVVVCGGGLILATAIHANPLQEEFPVPPSNGQLWARDGAAAPHAVAHVVRPEPLLDGTVNLTWDELAPGLPDFSTSQDLSTKKSRFFGYLLPMVRAENERLTAIRKRLGYIYDHVRWHRELTADDQLWLDQVLDMYLVTEDDIPEPDLWDVAFERIDVVPEDLVLVQAANESAWGTSRFAREGNNLFGQWCFQQGCGMVPAGRPAGATYEVARYESVRESIGSYMHNLNTGSTYQVLREIRAELRQHGSELDAEEMADGLVDYSERGVDYVNELRAMLRHNADMIDDIRQGGETDGNP